MKWHRHALAWRVYKQPANLSLSTLSNMDHTFFCDMFLICRLTRIPVATIVSYSDQFVFIDPLWNNLFNCLRQAEFC